MYCWSGSLVRSTIPHRGQPPAIMLLAGLWRSPSSLQRSILCIQKSKKACILLNYLLILFWFCFTAEALSVQISVTSFSTSIIINLFMIWWPESGVSKQDVQKRCDVPSSGHGNHIILQNFLLIWFQLRHSRTNLFALNKSTCYKSDTLGTLSSLNGEKFTVRLESQFVVQIFSNRCKSLVKQFIRWPKTKTQNPPAFNTQIFLFHQLIQKK